MGTAYIIAFMLPKLNARLKKDFTVVNVHYIPMLMFLGHSTFRLCMILALSLLL